jgi:hypothetical protein
MLDQKHKKSNLEQIISYLSTEDGAVILTEKQEEMLGRLKQADDLLRKNKHSTKEVARMLVDIFRDKGVNYSIATAWRDIDDARMVFGTTRTINKNYIVTSHIDEIDEVIKLAKSTSNFKLLPLLFDCKTKALAQLPDDDSRKNAPPAIIFNITNNTAIIDNNMTDDEAEAVVKEMMDEKGFTIDTEAEGIS